MTIKSEEFGGYSLQEIAKFLNITTREVETIYNEAIEKVEYFLRVREIKSDCYT